MVFCLFTVNSWNREWCLCLFTINSWNREWCFVCSLLILGIVSGVLSVHCYFLEA